MADIQSGLSKLKQPSPSLTKNDEEPKKTYNFPKVGVLKTPYVSNTPFLDEYIRKQEETPRIKYKEVFKKYKFLNIHNICSVGIIGVGFHYLFSFGKSIKNALKFKK